MAEVALLLKTLEKVEDSYWENKLAYEDYDTATGIKLQILNTAYNESN